MSKPLDASSLGSGSTGSGTGAPDYGAMARQLEAFGRHAAIRAAASGDPKLDALAQRLMRQAAQIRADLDSAATRRFGWRLGLFDLEPGSVRADDADAGAGGQVRPFHRPQAVADLGPAAPVDDGAVQGVQRADVLFRPAV